MHEYAGLTGISAEAGVTAGAGKADNAEMTGTSMADMTAGSEFC